MSTQMIPIPRAPVNVRLATLADVPFIDALQKKHTKQVGWMPTKQLEGKIAAGHVLIAEGDGENSELGTMNDERGNPPAPPFILHRSSFRISPLGYLISQDRYFKRDDVGIVYQLNVAPEARRKLVGATLLKAAFERAAWGCRLFCCWCAQDIEANRFWESMGFVPLAYRAGGVGRGQKSKGRSQKGPRVHIFWQKRIREGDAETPWWFPAKTDAGALREDRLVLPIPPGVKWSDEMPWLQLPVASCQLPVSEKKMKPSLATDNRQLATSFPLATSAPLATVPRRKPVNQRGGLFFTPIPPTVDPAKAEKPKREKMPKAKTDPKLVAAARELRDRYLEHVNSGECGLESAGKYDLTRALPAHATTRLPNAPVAPALLPAA